MALLPAVSCSGGKLWLCCSQLLISQCRDWQGLHRGHHPAFLSSASLWQLRYLGLCGFYLGRVNSQGGRAGLKGELVIFSTHERDLEKQKGWQQCSCFLFLWSVAVSEMTVMAAARVAVEIWQEEERGAERGCHSCCFFNKML